MRYIKTYILLALLAIFSSCEMIENPDDFKAKQINLFARMGVHLSVEQMTKDGDTDGLQIGMIRKDENVNDNTFLTAYLRNPDPENGGLRMISGFATSSGASMPQFFKNSTDKVTYTAWYPKTENITSANGDHQVTFSIPNTGDKDIMYSKPVSGTMSSGFDVMQFNHALSLFRIYVYKSTNREWESINNLSINKLPDICTVSLPSEENESEEITYSYSNSSGIDLVQEYNDAIEIPEGFKNKVFIKEWIAAPSEVEISESKFKSLSIKINDKYTVDIARNFMPGHAYDIILRFSDDGIVNADVEIQDWKDSRIDINTNTNISAVFYNLSENGNANCYIVSSANFSYCFDATVKGNGSTAAMPGSMIDPTLNPKSVKIIWSEVDTNTVFRLETKKIVEGKVLFTLNGNDDKSDKSLTQEQEGNVLLGVYDENGSCLWTWHIWITDRPQKQNYTKGYIVLDRNLGATAAAPNENGTMNGLFYQWGRPTPFRIINAPSVAIDDEGNAVTKVIDGEDRQERVTPDMAVANPKYFYGRFENPESPGSTENFHDWVDRTKFQHINNLWGYREEEHEKPIKTLYDPCPPGYHVPYSRNWGNMDAYWVDKEAVVVNETKLWENLDGIHLKIEEGTSEQIWYPFQGYVNKDGFYKEGHMHIGESSAEHNNTPVVEVWSALINRHILNDTDDDYPYRFMFTKERNTFGKYSRLSDAYSNRSRGLAVRCVSDNTADVVKDLSASQTANCYMVHEDGYYKFKATVRGNGVGSLLPLGGTTTAEINGGLSTNISPYKVDILWWQGDFTRSEDFPSPAPEPSTSAPTNMCLQMLDGGVLCEDGYASFQISGFKKGNLVLAAYDEYGAILWTWHIWLTDKPKDRLSGNYTKMDRFLGATYAPVLGTEGNLIFDSNTGPTQYIEWKYGELQSTFGFYYQWGRKDPIIGPPSPDVTDDDSSGDNVASAGWWKKDKNSGQWSYVTSIPVKNAAYIPEVVKDPTAFYKSTTERSAKNSQWFPESFADGYTNVALWGYAVKDYGIQGQTFSKTMHDPCPPGYRTPFHFSWRYDGTYKYAEGDGGEGVTYFIHEAWFELWKDGVEPNGIVTNKLNFERMWYPFAGYRDPLTGGYKEVGSKGYMYTGMPMGQYNTRSFWYSQSQSGQYADKYGHGSAYGKMIRCMKE